MLPAVDVDYCSLNTIEIGVLQEQANANSWLQSPFEKDRLGRLHAKCTRINDDRGVITNDHMISTTYSMYTALLNPDHCFDQLRCAFFCPSAEDKKEYIIELISSELERRSQSNEMVESLLKVRELLVSWKELTLALQAEPTWVTSCLWKFWKECVRSQHYWFSCDELLMFAHLSKMNVIVCKQCAATVYDVFWVDLF